MEAERTKKFQTRERIYKSAILYPHPVPSIISIHENLSNLPCHTCCLKFYYHIANPYHTKQNSFNHITFNKESGNTWAQNSKVLVITPILPLSSCLSQTCYANSLDFVQMAWPQMEGGRKRQREYDTSPASKGANGTMHIKIIF